MKQELDMVTVRKYVDACDSRGWRPVFTREQYLALWFDHHPPDMRFTGFVEGRVWTCFGVVCTIDDSPRPPMPAELLARW